MIFKINRETYNLEPFKSVWMLKELELEKYLLPHKDSDELILAPDVFGEPLLLISNQVKTRLKKRADILALDRAGRAVIIELKRDNGTLGVETQALQYLADFSAYQGQNFISYFAKDPQLLEQNIRGFLGNQVPIESINRRSRVILMARSFDPSLFSMGEWLSKSGVAFRCIEYTSFEMNNEFFLSFSVAFDRSPEPLYPLIFQSRAREPGYFWHNIGYANQEWWAFLVQKGQISTGFSNQPGDEGERILKSYVSGGVIIAYAKSYGAVGWGKVENPNTYQLLVLGDPDDRLNGIHLHRLRVVWKVVAPHLEQGIRPEILRKDFGIYHPVSTSVSIDSDKARKLITLLNQRFVSTAKTTS
jgi:hypothetical protein